MVPQHIAIIPDGSRRYAKAHGISQVDAYSHGIEQIASMLEWLHGLGVRHVSAFAASGENVEKRSRMEMIAVFTVIGRVCQRMRELPFAHLHTFGGLEGIPDWAPNRESIMASGEPSDDQLTIHLGINYSGDNEQSRSQSSDVPAVDLLVRTGGQHRLSGFLPMQMQYAELWFTDTLWPAFERTEFEEALEWFSSQKRNFGH